VESVTAPARRVAWALLPAAAVGLLALAAALLAARRIARPVADLSLAADAVARGETASVEERGGVELAHLARRFNEMADAVRGVRTELEVRVRQRTEELTRANAELEAQKQELVAQRQELEQQQRELREKNAEVERGDRLKSEFLANMSHELRTPLNSIIGFSELLAEQAGAKLTPAEGRYLHDVQASGRHLLQLINDILDLSKIEAGHVVLDLAEVDPGAAVAEATGLVLPAARAKRIDVRAAAAAVPAVRADPAKLRQVLLNLLANAIKFAPEGSAVEVGAAAAGDRVRFSVRDRGPGIDPALQARLFQPFVQGESPLVKKHQGTGLGLAICKRLVELQGGEIAVESAPGAGATFSFTLPAAPGAAPAAGEDAKPLVLLVEESAAGARTLREWLEGEGYRVVHVDGGVDAWELAARIRPAAVVLDPAAEGRDAFRLLDDLKRRKATRHIPVVLSTTPAAEFATKPPEREQILGTVADSAGPGGGALPPTVLAIDDDPGARAILRAIIEPAGYRVLLAEAGTVGLELARAERPSVVIVDLVMPDLSGFDVIVALQADERTRDVPIVVLTGADLAPADRARLDARVRAISAKGAATREELLAAIRRATARPAPPAGATVVVVDDNDLNRELARALLERRGWRVLLADGGEAGLALVRRERPALVVCDLAMPGLDGLAVARELKTDPATARIPLVALTALAMRGDEQRAYAAGFDAYLTKPIDRQALDATLARLRPGAPPPARGA
jgi:signal transduction histidine kinase/DNA-binding response OmpR family regulator